MYSQELQLVLVLLVCALGSCREVQEPRGEREATGSSSREESTYNVIGSLKSVCSQTTTAFRHDVEIVNTGESKERYKGLGEFLDTVKLPAVLYDKPVTVSNDSVCAGIEVTCCKPTSEKLWLIVAAREYREVFHAVLWDEYQSNCASVGRELYHAMQVSLRETKRILEIRLRDAMNTTLNNPEVIDDLFDYLVQFSISPDLCPLRQRVRRVVHDVLYSITVHTAFDSDLDPSELDINDGQRKCLENITSSYITSYTEKITTTIQGLLDDYRTFLQAMSLAKKVVSIVTNHKFSPACTVALTRMKHCAYCGGYGKFQPCLNLCLNTLRGCLADVAELGAPFQTFLVALRKLSKSIDSELQPEALLNKQFKGITDMAAEMSILAPKVIVVGATCGAVRRVSEGEIPGGPTHADQPGSGAPEGDDTGAPERDDTGTPERSRRSRFSQPITSDEEQSGSSFNLNLDFFDTSVPIALSNEQDCLEVFGNLLPDIPQEMCFLSKSRAIVAHSYNEKCWTGVTYGDYLPELVGRSKREQKNNSAFIIPLEEGLVYEPVMDNLVAMTTEINEVLNFRSMCEESDDEDCVREVSLECHTPSSGSGSASGSGSGSGLALGSGDPLPGFDNIEEEGGARGEQFDMNPEEFSDAPYYDPPSDLIITSTASDDSNESPPTETLGTIGTMEITAGETTPQESTAPTTSDSPVTTPMTTPSSLRNSETNSEGTTTEENSTSTGNILLVSIITILAVTAFSIVVLI